MAPQSAASDRAAENAVGPDHRQRLHHRAVIQLRSLGGQGDRHQQTTGKRTKDGPEHERHRMESQHAVFLQRFADHFPFANRIVDACEHPLEHRVARRLAGDVECLQNRHTAGDQRSQRSCGPGQDILFDQADRKSAP